MTARLPVVHAERRHQLEHRLHVGDLAALDAPVPRLLKLALQVTRTPDTTRHGEALRRVVGEQQREIEQSGQRQETASGTLDRDDHEQHRDGDRGELEQRLGCI